MLRPQQTPLLDEELSAVASLLERPVVAIDVGSRDGVREGWRALGPNAVLVGFDPDPEECARLTAAADRETTERYVPRALGAVEGTATLHLTRDPQSSSLYEPNARTIERYPELWRHAPKSTEQVAITTLDAWAEGEGIERVDALKVDVQGAELDVLRGGDRLLPTMRVVEAEVEFQELYTGQPLFCDVDRFMRERGFELWRLRDLHHCTLEPTGRAEPLFGVGDHVEHTRLGGQLAWGNAIWVRSEMTTRYAALDWQARARDACVTALFGLPELVRLALTGAREGAPAQERTAFVEIERAMQRREQATRLEDLLRRAPTRVRGMIDARLPRRS